MKNLVFPISQNNLTILSTVSHKRFIAIEIVVLLYYNMLNAFGSIIQKKKQQKNTWNFLKFQNILDILSSCQRHQYFSNFLYIF